MGYYTILMPREHAWEVLNQLGELNALQFVDLNADQPVFSKPYSNFVKRCDEMENKIEIILKEMERFKKQTTKCDNVETFLHNLKKFLMHRQKAERTYFDEVESELNERLKSLLEQVRIRDTLIEKYDHLVEYRQVLFRAYSFVSGSGSAAHDMSINSDRGARDEERKFDLSFRGSENIRFTYLAGVIDKEDSLRFKRILFRMTRGMVWTTLMDIERPQTEAEKNDFDHLIDTSSEAKLKTVFLIVYQGGSHEMMAGKLNKICDSFGASKYGLPADRTSYDRKLVEVEAQLKEAKSVISVTEKHIDMILEYFAKPRTANLQYSLIEELKLFVVKEKVIYDNLNKLKSQNTLYRGCCWCTSRNVPRVYDTIAQLKASSRSGIGGCEFQEITRPADSTPPTHFETNEVTWVFQEIVNTYGIPRYREINPGLFAIATFPFLFGVMFGDIGHGALLFIFGLYLVLFKKSIEDDKNNLVRLLIPARYLLILQGFFAFYCGLIYNDFMSLTFNIFGTCYSTQADGSVDKDIDCTYPVGIDSSWGGKANELTYMNSFKMKLAIVLGVTQMLFGILMRGWNCINWRNWVDFFCEFIPMLLFMSLTFGYMVVLIFIKWSIPWGTEEYPTSQAPSIIGIFIKMVLEPGKWPQEAGMPLYGDASGEHQAKTQLTFLLIAGICALVILVPKPLILLWRHRKGSFYNLVQGHHDRTMDKRLLNNPEHPELELVQHHSPEEEQKDDSQERGLLERSRSNSSHSFSNLELDEHFEFGEVFVHQVIEAIEFVLGSISSTASYLRLWALSLAHSQLAKVFFDNCIKSSIQSGSIIGLFIGFIIFGQLTLGVLLLMDQMECFLHALRLHWVEFQNKFYKADGHSFIPFSYKRAVTQFVSQ